jgi:hypothetical protein
MKNFKLNLVALSVSSILISACGGGGGGSTPVTPPVVTVPAPVVSLSFASPKAAVGTPVVLTWSSTGATSCTGSDGLSGALLTSTSTTITPSVGGVSKFTVSCTGAGGTTSKSADLITPIPVQKTSYLNFKNNGRNQTKLPEYAHAIAYGDFFQDGTVSLMTSPVIADIKNPADINKVGTVKFYKNINSVWVDKTSDILKDSTGCVWPRKAVSADFNGDQKPDIFLSCHGFDVTPFAGEKQILFLSQSDGTYKRSVLDIDGYCHGATAADFTGSGFADLVTTCSNGGAGVTYFKNNKNGTFAASFTEISALTKPTVSLSGSTARGIYSVEFVDANADGQIDLFVGGIDSYNNVTEAEGSLSAWAPRVFLNHAGMFNQDFISLPIDKTYSVTLDILVDNSNMFVMKTNYTNTQFKVIQANTSGATITESFLTNNGIFWIIKDTLLGIVTAAN